MRRLRFGLVVGCGLATLLGLVVLVTAQQPQSGIANPGFEEPGSPPSGWSLEEDAAGKGKVATEIVAGASGQALALSPNAKNLGGDKPLGLGQMIDAKALRGRLISLQARLAGSGGAAAIVGFVFLDAKGTMLGAPVTLRAAEPLPLAVQTLRLEEPVPAAAQNAIVFVVAEGQTGTAYFDDIAILTDPAPAPPKTASGTPFQAQVSIDPAVDLGPVRRALYGTNVEWIRNAQGLWNATTHSLDAETLGLAKTAGISVLRFPGGGWSDSYDWRNGVGPQSSRAMVAHAPGDAESSPNVLGTDEIIEAARRIDADLLLTLNLGNGTPELAAGWASYVRTKIGPGDRPHVTWELGNELYMQDDISRGQTDPASYVVRARATIAAVRVVDPQAHFYAIGLENYGRYHFNAHPGWNTTVLEGLATEIDGLAVHDAYAPLLPGSAGGSAASIYRAMLAAPVNIAANLATTTRQLEAVEGPRRLALAVTEWGPLFAVDPNNRFFDHVKTLGSGVFVARVLNVFSRNPRVKEAEFFKLDDLLNAGWIGRKPGGGYAATPALEVLRLYARTLSGRLVETRVDSPTFAGGPVGFIDHVAAAATVEAVASKRDDGSLAVIISNASLDAPAAIDVNLDTVRSGTVEILSGPAPDASRGTGMISVPGLTFAETANFGVPRPQGRDEIVLTTTPVAAGRVAHLVLPPMSVAAFVSRVAE